MMKHLVGWLRHERKPEQTRGRLARLIGRGWARVHYATRVEPTWLEVNHLTIPVPNLPLPFAGLRIVQLTDFHCSRRVTPTYLDEAVDMALAQKADVIALTGDFIHQGFAHIGRIADVLSRLHAPLGVFAVLGNHDFSVRNALGLRRFPHLHQAVGQALTARGIRVLRNEQVALRRGGAELHLVGVEDLWSRVCDLKQALGSLCPSLPRVVLAHNPTTVEHLAGRRCDLMLSGHTHGGQVNLPGLGRVTLSRKGKRFAAGLYQYHQSYLYVNKGVGYGFRVRFGVRPEVAVLTLEAGPLP